MNAEPGNHQFFQEDLKTCRRRILGIQKLDYIFQKLLQEEDASLFKDLAVIGNWTNDRELHIQADWLLIYRKTPEGIIAVRTGSHADLFEKHH
ncbi:type II toxin-antitoxin system YafQ family toxin [Turicimonas sp. TL08]